MEQKITELLKRPYALLIWALICGGAYLVLIGRFIMRFTNTAAGGGMLIWIFCPAIVCGAALILIKAVKRAMETENDKGALMLFYAHLIVIAMGIVFFAEGLIG